MQQLLVTETFASIRLISFGCFLWRPCLRWLCLDKGSVFASCRSLTKPKQAETSLKLLDLALRWRHSAQIPLGLTVSRFTNAVWLIWLFLFNVAWSFRPDYSYWSRRNTDLHLLAPNLEWCTGDKRYNGMQPLRNYQWLRLIQAALPSLFCFRGHYITNNFVSCFLNAFFFTIKLSLKEINI